MTEPLADIADRLERCFIVIERTRMEGVPILNAALEVKAIGMREWGESALCVLLTPWFMNLMLLGLVDEARVGDKRLFAFPAGRFEFIRGREEAIGSYWMCSLFSPVFEFADQETAEAAASAALEELMRADDALSEREAEMAMIWRGETPPVAEAPEIEEAPPVAEKVSRRAFLRGDLREEER